MTEPLLMTIREVAELWHISDDTVRRQVKSGELPAVRFGRTVRIRRDLAVAIARGEIPRQIDDRQEPGS